VGNAYRINATDRRWASLFLSVAAGLSLAISGTAQQTPTLASPCEYSGDGGSYRWGVKVDSTRFTARSSVAYTLMPSQLFGWEGGRGTTTGSTPRQGREQQWVEVTGRVTLIKIEEDGDLHIELEDVDGSSPARIVAEVPHGRGWCGIRRQVLTWTRTNFPISASGRALNLARMPVIRVVGKAFWDAAHASRARAGAQVRANRRTYDKHSAVWEVHPVMKLEEVRR
jgi:hypothetical protein